MEQMKASEKKNNPPAADGSAPFGKGEFTTPQVPSLEREGRRNPSPDKNRGLPLGKGELRKRNNPRSDENRSTPFIKGDFSAWQLAWELGYTIAIPIVALALLGRYADKAWGTSPWMLLVGVVISVIISSFLVYQKVKKIF